jgi:hypothetical protein
LILLAQGGKFGIVAFQAAARAGVIETATASLLTTRH